MATAATRVTLEVRTADHQRQSAAALVHLWMTCEAVSRCLDWDDWLTTTAAPLYTEASNVMNDAMQRHKRMASA